jgi:hypothetical protein
MAPFVSEAQRRALWAKNPMLAAEFEAATPEGANLPEHVAQAPKRKRAQSPKMIGPAARRRW